MLFEKCQAEQIYGYVRVCGEWRENGKYFEQHRQHIRSGVQ